MPVHSRVKRRQSSKGENRKPNLSGFVQSRYRRIPYFFIFYLSDPISSDFPLPSISGSPVYLRLPQVAIRTT